MPAETPSSFDCPPVAILNPGGRDPFLDYRNGPNPFQHGVHPPVNFHAFAACSRGAFCQITREVLEPTPSRFHHVILLLRSRMVPCLQAIRTLHQAGLQVFVSWKECGFTQIAEQLAHPDLWKSYAEILSLAQGIVSPTGWPVPLPPSLPAIPVHPLLTPYPVDVPGWDYSAPLPERSGIFLGTREFFQPSRNHLAALTLALRVAKDSGSHVTVINSEKRPARRLLESLANGLPDGCLRVIEGRLSYEAYLRTLAAHRVVFQLDRSSVPGQVAGDALLCRSVCVGGNSAIEQAVFPEHGSPQLAEGSVEAHLTSLLKDDGVLEKAIASSQRLAQEKLSFASGASQLTRILLRQN